jgi:hypothetical protein
MPLAFDSISHGTVAFGFFNIDSDMLLLDQYFFFATEFCAERKKEGPMNIYLQGYQIPYPEDIGDLMGAIHGIHYKGFIGEVYTRFPFPKRPEEFKQKPDGLKNRTTVEDIITKYANPVQIPIPVDEERQEVEIGAYRFSWDSFQELIKYVWRGGYPRWKDEVRPDYVLDMKEKIERNRSGLFEGIIFEE